jgi:nanoRNase/pAp phosphatase (c-di-AMP/oligoRNAs hydrolase)
MDERPTSESDVAARLDLLGQAVSRRGPVWIFTHDYPDPDALASAGAMHLLLEKRFGKHSHIVFTGATERAENRELMRHFRFRTTPTERMRAGRRRLTAAMFVDCQPWAGNIIVPAAARPVAVFDHHPLKRRARTEGLFLDIRPALGATASMLWEYLHACDLAPPSWLATCLCYAIQTETTDFTRSWTALDRQAYLALLARADLKMLGRIRNPPLPQRYFSIMQEAIARSRLYGRIAWSHVDAVPNPEVVAEIADRLVRLERITWSFCTGRMENQLLVSLRSTRRDARCDRVLKAVMKDDARSGGHDRMAAGRATLRSADPAARNEEIRAFTRALLRRLDSRHALRDADEALESRLLTPAEGPAAPGPGSESPPGRT